MKQSFGNVVALKPYTQGQGVKTEMRGGFAFTQQKKNLFATEVVITAWHPNGSIIPAGSKAYLREDDLAAKPWAKDIRKIDGTNDEVILVDFSDIVFFETKDE